MGIRNLSSLGERFPNLPKNRLQGKKTLGRCPKPCELLKKFNQNFYLPAALKFENNPRKNEVFATIETIKAASEIYMPISGEIVEINETLINSPELINEEPFNFWLIKVKPNDLQEDIQGLVDYNDYRDEI